MPTVPASSIPTWLPPARRLSDAAPSGRGLSDRRLCEWNLSWKLGRIEPQRSETIGKKEKIGERQNWARAARSLAGRTALHAVAGCSDGRGAADPPGWHRRRTSERGHWQKRMRDLGLKHNSMMGSRLGLLG